MNAPIDSLRPAESNSGATFLQDKRFFFKLGVGTVASRLKPQSLWLASLDQERALRFPRLTFAYWSSNRAVQTFERVQAPLASAWMNSPHGPRVALLMASVVDWLAQSLHRPQLPSAHHAAMLTLNQTRERSSRWPREELLLSLMRGEVFCMAGLTLRGVDSALARVHAILATGKYDRSALSLIHGDVHLGNIMSDLDSWWLIDPRGSFPGGNQLFDPYYEWGKIYHECYAQYTNVVRGRMRVGKSHDGLRFRASLEDRAFYAGVENAVGSALSRQAPSYGEEKIDFNRLALFVGLILLGIVPFHAAYLGRAETFVAAGLYALNAFIDAEQNETSLERLPSLPFAVDEEPAP